MLSYIIDPSIILIVALALVAVFSLCYLFKDQIEEIKTRIRKANILHKKLKKFCKNHDYILLTNLILPTSDGKRIKIDDLIIADKYIYIISQRILYGNISGVEEDAKWIVRSTKESKYFSNPFKSNEIRLQVVANLSNIETLNFVNMVCFSKTAFIKDVRLENKNKVITNIDKIEKDIISHEKTSDLNDFKNEDVETLAAFLYQTSKQSTRK